MKKIFCSTVNVFIKKILKSFKKETADEKMTRLFKNAYIKSQKSLYITPKNQKIIDIAAEKVAARMLVTNSVKK